MFVASLSPSKTRGLIAALAAAAAVVVPLSSAGAVNGQVRSACAGDYLTHCSNFAPNSAETRRCMRAVGSSLSEGCINALVVSGEVKAKIARRTSTGR
jgi:hypothetical protein